MEFIETAVRKTRSETDQHKDAPTNQATAQQAVRFTRTRVHRPHPEVLLANRIVTNDSPSEWLDAYKVLRTQVIHRMEKNGWKTLAVTSPGANEGKSLTAANLAVCMAMEYNRTVLLVDANLQRPSLDRLFDLPDDRGLRDYLLDQVPLPELLINPGISDLVILPAGKPVPHSSELLRSPYMTRLVEEFKHRYPERMVIFDLPEVMSKADTLAFAPYVDAVMLVAEAGKTSRSALEKAMDHLSETPILGTVLNKSRMHH